MTRRKRSKAAKPFFSEYRDAADALQSVIVRARMGLRSEYSGKGGTLHVHHIDGKDCLEMRYCRENLVAITAGEHKFIAHNAASAAQFRVWAMERRGVTDEFYAEVRRRPARHITEYYSQLRSEWEQVRRITLNVPPLPKRFVAFVSEFQ